MLVLAAAAFIALFAFDVPFPVVIVAAGLAGLVGAQLRPGLFTPGDRKKGPAAELPAVIGESYVEPRGRAGRSLVVLGAWGALWLAPLALVVPIFGWGSVLVSIFVFFSQMAVVTFGGAYAVLAYVAQQAVETYGWLNPGEMLDGLALAETTPGPLVLVLTHVGFLAAFRAPMGLDPLLAGLLGALLTTWVTFVPCFLWIFLGAPHVERLRANRVLSGALAAITAAVVGVILNLAIWFGLHVLFGRLGEWRAGSLSVPLPDWTSLDPLALALFAGAAVLLIALRLNMLLVLAIAAAAGLALGAASLL